MNADTMQQIMDAAIAQVQDSQKKEPVHYFSTAADCPRALGYDLRKGTGARPPRELKHALAMVVGQAVGALIESGCARLGWPTQEKVKLGTGEFAVLGSLDIRMPGRVLDLKVVGEKSWKRVTYAPNDKHVHQVNGYAAAAKEPAWALAYLRAISIFKDGDLEWRIFRGTTDAAKAQRIVETWRNVHDLNAKGELPPRPADYARDRFPCGWCAHAPECWEEANA